VSGWESEPPDPAWLALYVALLDLTIQLAAYLSG
jgi:hypothetical protein